MKNIITFGCLLFLMIITSCGSSKSILSVASLSESTWVLESLNGEEVKAIQGNRVQPYINFSRDNKISGNSGCNGFSGSYNLNDEGGINISQLAATKMYCEGSKEPVFFKMIETATMVKMNKKKLTFLEGTKEVAVFVAGQESVNQ